MAVAVDGAEALCLVEVIVALVVRYSFLVVLVEVEVDLVAALEVEVVVALEDLVEEAAAAAVPAEAGNKRTSKKDYIIVYK